MVKMQTRFFWKYNKTLRKDNTPLRLNNQLITNAKEKTDTLNNQFYLIFTYLIFLSVMIIK